MNRPFMVRSKMVFELKIRFMMMPPHMHVAAFFCGIDVLYFF